MEEYGVDENTALAALAAEHQGFPPEDVINVLKQRQGVPL
jgi:UDP-N-acetylmuramyl tripeptide synthase